jgi:hypothetical protein
MFDQGKNQPQHLMIMLHSLNVSWQNLNDYYFHFTQIIIILQYLKTFYFSTKNIWRQL